MNFSSFKSIKSETSQFYWWISRLVKTIIMRTFGVIEITETCIALMSLLMWRRSLSQVSLFFWLSCDCSISLPTFKWFLTFPAVARLHQVLVALSFEVAAELIAHLFKRFSSTFDTSSSLTKCLNDVHTNYVQVGKQAPDVD